MEFIDENLAQCLRESEFVRDREFRDAHWFLGYEVVSKVSNRPNLHHISVPDGLQAANE